VVLTSSVAQRLGVKEEWILQRLGPVRQRHALAEGERITDLASLAARRAIEDAGLEPADIDLVVAATTTHDDLLPNMAPLVAGDVGTDRAGAFDVGAACAGFISALSIGASQIESHRAEAVLAIGTDGVSRFVDPDDRGTAALFGDGAGAVVLRADDDARIGPCRLWSDAVGRDTIRMTRERPLLHMEGLEVYRFAVAALTEATRALLEEAGLTVADVDLFVYHQANSRILRAVADRLELADHQRVESIATTGNTSAASIPLALAAARDEQRLQPGVRVLLGAIGAGFIWGTCLVQWGGNGAPG